MVPPIVPGAQPKKTRPEDGPASPSHRIYDWFAARPDLFAVLLYSAVALAGFVTAYVGIFSQFVRYDDEGTLLTTVRAFVEGDTLYRDVFSPYGPFYYEVFGGLFALTGWSVTTDASRLIVVVVWVLTSALYGFVVHRLTGRLTLGASGMIVAFAVLVALVGEPMHPHGLASLLIAGFALLAVLAPGRRSAIGGLAAGALLGALVLTKINLGAFALAAFALAAVLAVEPLHRRRWIRWPVIVAFLSLPVAVMARDLGEPWVRDFITLELLASMALVVAASALPPRSVEGEAVLWRWLAAAVAGAVGLGTAVIGVLLVLGLSVSDVYEGVVTEALGIRDAFVLPFVLPDATADWGIAALAAAAICAWMHSRRTGIPALVNGVLRVVVGLVIWLTIARSAPFNLSPEASHVALPLVLAWVAALPPAGVQEGPVPRFVRILLPALAVAQVLQIYPVAGNQQSIAAVTFVPVGALCLADGLRILRDWSASKGEEVLRHFGAITLILSLALVGKFGLEKIVRPGLSNYQAYSRVSAVALPGAGRLHLVREQGEAYERLVELLRENRCSTLLSYPGLNSFYLWSSLPVPKPQLPGPWMLMLDDTQQQKAVDWLHDSEKPCAIRNDGAAEDWLHGRSAADAPLVRYLSEGFRLEEEVGEFQFLLPRDDA